LKTLFGICFVILASHVGYAQTTLISPTVTLGITPLVINHPASIQVLVSNPTFSPVPTGQVTVDFGDGSDPVPLTISTTRVETTHTFTTPGLFTITASYSGDSNFAAATKSFSAESILSSPVYTLHLFGDSLTGGSSSDWPALLTGALGWPKIITACGGCKTNDLSPYIYASMVDTTFASTWLLGQNDGTNSVPTRSQFQHSALAENAWLAIPEGRAKMRAQSSTVAQTGSWVSSDLYPTTGLRGTAADSTLTASIPGSTIYVGLSSLLTTDFTVDVMVDGIDLGTASPVSVDVGTYFVGQPYALRYVLGGEINALHTVQVICQTPGTSGCYVDWIGGNGAATRPNLPPYVWTGVTYKTLQPDPYGNTELQQDVVRAVESQLESDGLAIRVADIAALFNGPALPECVADGIHPAFCGNQIEETVWLSAMSYLATEAQRIDAGQVPTAVVGIPTTLEAEATSGLPLTYSVVSGSAITDGDLLTVQQAGNLVIEADQSGNSTVLPAAPVQFPVTVLLPTATSLSSSSLSADLGVSVTLTATVTSSGSPVTTGIVTFHDGATSLGASPVNSSGIATLSTTALPAGVNTVSASYAANAQLAASTSTAISVTIVPPDFTIAASVSQLTVKGNLSASTTLIVTPEHGFNQALTFSCAGLPVGASCAFGPPAPQTNGTLTIGLTIRALHGDSAWSPARPPHAPLYALCPIPIFLLRRRRKVLAKCLRFSIGVFVVAAATAGLVGAGVHPPPPGTSTVTVTAQTQAGLTHSTQLSVTFK